MAYRSGMFNSVGGDRKYQALHFAEYFATFIGNGVFPNPSNGLQVYAKENMTVTVKPGKAWINGYYFVNDSDFEIQLKVADGVLKRTDRIFLRFDIATRQIHPVVRSSGFSASPSTSQLQRDGDAYELALATINVGAGVIAITQSAIVDERLSGAVCGIVHGTVDQVDTTTLFNQYQTWLNEQKELYEQNVNQWTTDKKATFDAWLNQQADEYDDFQAQQQALFDVWFASIQNILSGDVAGNLALMITNHIDSNMHIYDATVSYVDGLYTLTTTKNIDNSYVTLRFKAPNVYQDGDKFKVGNDTYTATNVDFNENDIVMINLDKVNLLACGITTTLQIPLPAQVNTFTATGGDKKATLAWTNSNTANLEDYLIVYKVGSIPTTPTDGTRLVVAKTATSTTVTGLTNNSTYYFRIYPRNSKKQLQKTEKTASVTPIGGLLLSSLPAGTKIKDVNTKYNGATITWLVGGHNHYGANQTALVSERIISLKAFDAKEASNTDSNRKLYGNNRYTHSNLRQWLNSAAASWYAAQHSADAPPTNANVWNNNNEYDQEKGFLANFSANLRNALIPTSLTVAKNTVTDGGSSETVTDKVFLLSNTEVGLTNENSVAEGKLMSLFSTASNRIAKPTAAAVSKSEYKDTTSILDSKAWYYWLRTPNASYSNDARSVVTDGSLSNILAYYGLHGVRPALNLSSTTLVSQTPDSDGAYTILW